MSRYWWASAIFLLLAVLASGGCDKKSEPPAAVAFQYGSYRLETLNGERPPVVVEPNDMGHQEMMSGTLTLERDPSRRPENPGGNFTWIETSRFVPKGQPPAGAHDSKSTGIFFVGPTNLKLRFHSGVTDYDAEVTGGRITVTVKASC